MATCKDVIRKALRYCGESTNFSNAPDEDYLDGLDELNNLVNTWYELGLQLGDTEQEYTNINDPFGYPRFALSAFEYNLAVELWPLFNIDSPMPIQLSTKAYDSMNELFTIAGAPVNSYFPSQLPQGMGNWSVYRYNYYPDCSEPIYKSNRGSQVSTEGNAPVITENNNYDE